MSSTTTSIGRARRWAAAIVVAGLGLAACGSDSDGAAGTAATTAATSAATAAPADTTAATEASDTTAAPVATDAADTTAAPDTSAAPAGPECTAGAASGDAVKVGVIWPEGPAISLPELGEAANAAVSYANDCLNGIAGHQVELVDCQIDETNAATATDCANQMVEAGVVGVVATITSSGDTLVPILAGAGIPYVTSGASSPGESIDSTGFVHSLTGGVGAILGAMAQEAKDAGYTKVSLLVSDNAAGGVGGLAGIPFGKAGVEADVVPIPAGTADLTPQVTAAIAGGAQATAVIGDGTLCIGYLQAAATADAGGEHWVISTCTAGPVVEAVGADALEGAKVFTSNLANGTDPESVLYQQVMGQYSPDTDLFGFAPTGFLAMLGFIRGAAGVTGDVTAAAVNDAFKATKDIPVPAGAGTVFGCSGSGLGPLNTLCSTQAIVATITGGEAGTPSIVDAAPLFS